MKIVLTGGGTGGHFYPLIAVAEAIRERAREEKILNPRIYYFGINEYDAKMLFDHEIEFVKISAGKLSLNFSLNKIFEITKMAFGVFGALLSLYRVYPDVVFSKGGFAAFPVILAAKVLRIPLFIHDSDTVVGRVTLWSAPYAKRIALSWPEALDQLAKYKERVAVTGNPIRKSIQIKNTYNQGAEYFSLDTSVPTILIIGGSQGAEKINDCVLEALPELLNSYQVIHQTGKINFNAINQVKDVILENHQYKSRYHPRPFLSDLDLKMASGVAALIVSRAGSFVFEIAAFNIPSIIIPIPQEISRDQASNAFAYAKRGCASVIEQNNLSKTVLISEVNNILNNQKIYEEMVEATKHFSGNNAAKIIAKEVINIAISHEK